MSDLAIFLFGVAVGAILSVVAVVAVMVYYDFVGTIEPYEEMDEK